MKHENEDRDNDAIQSNRNMDNILEDNVNKFTHYTTFEKKNKQKQKSKSVGEISFSKYDVNTTYIIIAI